MKFSNTEEISDYKQNQLFSYFILENYSGSNVRIVNINDSTKSRTMMLVAIKYNYISLPFFCLIDHTEKAEKYFLNILHISEQKYNDIYNLTDQALKCSIVHFSIA